jgi:hypothetical protein
MPLVIIIYLVNEKGLSIECTVESANDSSLSQSHYKFNTSVDFEPNVDRSLLYEKYFVNFFQRLKNGSATEFIPWTQLA